MMFNILSCVFCWHLGILFSETSVYDFCHFLIGLFVFFTVDFWEFSIYSKHKPFVGYVACKYFLPVCRLCFHPFNRIFYRVKFFYYLFQNKQLFKNWSIVDLQCCVYFCCTAKLYIYIFFFISFSIMVYHRIIFF